VSALAHPLTPNAHDAHDPHKTHKTHTRHTQDTHKTHNQEGSRLRVVFAGNSLRAAPYDWRFGPETWAAEDWPRLRRLIEETYALNNNTPGTPTVCAP
jgi:hypothetical protein